jgi:hypothetical protein
MHSAFNIFIMIVICLNLIPIIWEMVRFFETMNQSPPPKTDDYDTGFNIANIVFTSIYTIEFIVKVSWNGSDIRWYSMGQMKHL